MGGAGPAPKKQKVRTPSIRTPNVPYAFVPPTEFQRRFQPQVQLPRLYFQPPTYYFYWQMPYYQRQFSNRPNPQAPVQQVPNMADLFREMAPKEAEPPAKKFREGLPQNQIPDLQSPYQDAMDRQPDPWGLRERIEAKERPLQVVRFDETPNKEPAGAEALPEKRDAPVAEEQSSERKEPLRPTKASEPAQRSQSSSCSEGNAGESPDTSTDVPVRSSGLTRSVKLGLGVALATLAVIGLAIGIWLFGRGVYENLEEM